MALTSAERVIFDGVDLKTYAKNTPSLGALLATPGRRGSNVPTAGRSGAVYTPGKLYDEASFPLPLWVIGCNDDGRIPSGSTARREFRARVDELTALFSKGSGLSELVHVQPDGSSRSLFVECIGAVDWSVTGSDPVGRVDFQLLAPDPFWRSTVDQTATLNPGTSTFFAGATAPLDDAWLSITGPITNPTITDPLTGASVRYGATVAAGQTVTIDAGYWSLTSTGGASAAFSLLTLTKTGGRLMRFVPDNVARGYRVQFSGTATSSATRLTVSGRPKYLNG